MMTHRDVAKADNCETVTSFTIHGREFSAEASLVVNESTISVSLFDSGRLIFSENHPLVECVSENDLMGALDDCLLTVKAQLLEMYDLSDEIAESRENSHFRLLAHLFESRGLLIEADRLYRVGEGISDDPDSLFRHGLCLTELGEYSQAVERLAAASTARPLYADYRCAYALALCWSGDIVEAKKQLDHALELNTYYADALYNYGLLYLFNGIKGVNRELSQDFVSKSRAFFEKAVVIDHSFMTPLYQQGVQALDSGDIRLCFSSLKRNGDESFLRSQPGYEDRRLKFLAAFRSSDKKTVLQNIAALSSQLESNPDFIDISFGLANAHLSLALCEWREGLEWFKKTLERNPDLKKSADGYDVARETLEKMEEVVTSIDGKRVNALN